MYSSCLNDVTSDSKNAITEIFKELAEYSEEVPFVPFSALKNIVDEMVDKWGTSIQNLTGFNYIKDGAN